jgi:hypothetical protein
MSWRTIPEWNRKRFSFKTVQIETNRIIDQICWACAIFRWIPNLQARTDRLTDWQINLGWLGNKLRFLQVNLCSACSLSWKNHVFCVFLPSHFLWEQNDREKKICSIMSWRTIPEWNRKRFSFKTVQIETNSWHFGRTFQPKWTDHVLCRALFQENMRT